ncbi:MAG: hypothetical protein Q7W56_10870 [Candidatus Latescibacteria bacterium]|nr:hypothetical protein [Candidatus Latescibacterota bacterium]
MHRRTSLIAFVSMCALLAPAGPARAGTARLLALGGDAGYCTDTVDVLRWYSSLGDYPDRAVFEFGDILHGRDRAPTDQGLIGHGGGVHARLSADDNWGTAAFYFQDHLPQSDTDGAFSALWSRRCGPLDVGLGGKFTTYGNSEVGTVVGDRIEAQYFHHYGLGVRGEPLSGLRLEAAGEIVNSRAESHGALYHMSPTNDWSTFGLRLRGFIELGPDLTLVPLIDHYSDQRATFDDVIDSPADLDAALTSLGIAANLRTDRGTLLLIGCEYRSGHQDLDLRAAGSQSSVWDFTERDFYQIRGRAGLETEVLPWLTARASMQYVRVHDDLLRATTDAHPDRERDRLEAVATPLTLGFALRHGRLTADFAHNDSAPVNPGLTSVGLFGAGGRGVTAFTLVYEF